VQAGEIASLLAEATQVWEGSELRSATERFDATLKRRGRRLVVFAVRREGFLEENRPPSQEIVDVRSI